MNVYVDGTRLETLLLDSSKLVPEHVSIQWGRHIDLDHRMHHTCNGHSDKCHRLLFLLPQHVVWLDRMIVSIHTHYHKLLHPTHKQGNLMNLLRMSFFLVDTLDRHSFRFLFRCFHTRSKIHNFCSHIHLREND